MNLPSHTDNISSGKTNLPMEVECSGCYPTEGLRISPRRGEKRLLCTAAGLLWIMGAAISFTADMLLNSRPTWSVYVLVSCAYGILQCISVVALARRFPIANILASYLLTNGAVAALSGIATHSARFYLILGLPISSILCALALAVVISKRLTRLKTLNLAALFFILSIPCAIGMDLLISTYIGKTSMTWSFFSLAFCLPMAGICVCAYFYLKRKEAFFHR